MKRTNLFMLLVTLLILSQTAYAGGVTYYDCMNQDGSMSYRIYRCDKGQSEVRKFDVDLDELARSESRKHTVGSQNKPMPPQQIGTLAQTPQVVPIVTSAMRDGGLSFSFEGWTESQSIAKWHEGEIRAQSGAKLVLIRINLQNVGKESADIFCNFHLGHSLFDKEGRKFDHIKEEDHIKGNTKCNDNIQPGFGNRETLAFEIPANAVPDYIKLWDPRDISSGDRDSFGEKTSVRFSLR